MSAAAAGSSRLDVSGSDRGYVDLGATELDPLRAGVTRVRATSPAAKSVPLGPGGDSFVGSVDLHGPWVRLAEPPPTGRGPLRDWAIENHRGLIDEQLRFARAFGEAHKRAEMPAIVAFVYPDEGPNRGEIHDAWLFLVIRSDGSGGPARAFHLRSDERWLRQPQLHPLEDKPVALVGAGALGSQPGGAFMHGGSG